MQMTPDEQSHAFGIRVTTVTFAGAPERAWYSLWGEAVGGTAPGDYFLTDDASLLFFASLGTLIDFVRASPRSFMLRTPGGRALVAGLARGEVSIDGLGDEGIDFEFDKVDALIDALSSGGSLTMDVFHAAHSALNAYVDIGATLASLDGCEDAFFFPRLVGDEPLSLILDWGHDVREADRAQDPAAHGGAASVLCLVAGVDLDRAREDYLGMRARFSSRSRMVR